MLDHRTIGSMIVNSWHEGVGRLKKLGIFAAVLVVALGVAWMFRGPLALELIGLRTQMTMNIGPHQEITWRGGNWRGQGERPPNIVLILADDLGWNDLTINGGVAGGTVPTPHIDSIAKDGAFFRNGHSAFGTCAPSRAALMSGRYPTRFGFEFTPTPPGMMSLVSMLASAGDANAPPLHFQAAEGGDMTYENMGMPSSEFTLAEALKEQGYYTAHIGKWHLGRSPEFMPNAQGFDDSLLMASGLYLREDDPSGVLSKQEFDGIDRFLWKALTWAASFNGGEPFEPGGYLTDYYTDEALNVIEANKDRPFFLYLAHWAPHTPLQATKEDYDALSHIELHRERVYAAMIRSLDRGVGQVMDKLKELGLEENTLVIFTSDNGGAGYIGIPGVNDPYRGYKITFFEGGIHVPYFMKWPAKIAPGTVSDVAVHHFDIWATAAAAGGATPVNPVDGVNLLPWAQGSNAPEASPHEALFWRADTTQVAKTADWKFIRDGRQEKVWLFNMKSDPTEQKNVADTHPAVVAEMETRLDAWNAEQSEPLWPSQLASPQRIDNEGHIPWQEGEEYIYSPN